MALPSVSLHVVSGLFSLSMWILHGISPARESELLTWQFRALKSTKARPCYSNAQAQNCRINSTPNTASREETIQVVLAHQNVIEYHTLLGLNCTHSPLPTPCFPSTSPSTAIFLIFLGLAQSYFYDYILDTSPLSHTGNNHSFIGTSST